MTNKRAGVLVAWNTRRRDEAAREERAMQPMRAPTLIACRTCEFTHQWQIPCPRCCNRFGTAPGPLLGVGHT